MEGFLSCEMGRSIMSMSFPALTSIAGLVHVFVLNLAHTLRKEPFWLFKKTQRKISKNTLRRANCLALQES